MGAATEAFREGLAVTARNPLYVVVATVAAVLGAVVSVVLTLTLGLVPLVGQLLASLLNGVVVTPLVAAGVLGMAYAASLDRGSPAAFLEAIRHRGKSMMGAYAAINLLFLAVGVAGTVALVVVGTFVLGMGSAMQPPDAGPGAMSALLGGAGLVVLGLGLALVAVLLLCALVLQFVGVAVVVGGESATSSFRAAWGVVRSNPLSVLGYSLLRGLPGLVLLGLVGVAYAAGHQAADPLVGMAVAGVVVVVFGPVAYAFLNAYHVSYYQRVAA